MPSVHVLYQVPVHLPRVPRTQGALEHAVHARVAMLGAVAKCLDYLYGDHVFGTRNTFVVLCPVGSLLISASRQTLLDHEALRVRTSRQ
jgi:hypothetical protein